MTRVPSIRRWPSITAGIALLSLSLLLLVCSFCGNETDRITPFLGGFISDNGRLWSAALLAAACGSALLYTAMKSMNPKRGVTVVGACCLLMGLAVVVQRCPRTVCAPIPVTRTIFQALSTALDIYSQDCGSYPEADHGLTCLLTNPGAANWNGPYIRGQDLPADAWGTPIAYLATQRAVTLLSAGPDQCFGTSDDIVQILEQRRP
jgi:type II secretion system protein G